MRNEDESDLGSGVFIRGMAANRAAKLVLVLSVDIVPVFDQKK